MQEMYTVQDPPRVLFPPLRFFYFLISNSCTRPRDHLQTCQTKSAASKVHDWLVYRLDTLFGSVGRKVKIHKITAVTGKERGDFTMTHVRFGRSHLHPVGQLTHTRCSDDQCS